MDDAPALAELVRVKRALMAPWEPVRIDEYYTVDGQLADIGTMLDPHADGACLPHVIVGDDGHADP